MQGQPPWAIEFCHVAIDVPKFEEKESSLDYRRVYFCMTSALKKTVIQEIGIDP